MVLSWAAGDVPVEAFVVVADESAVKRFSAPPDLSPATKTMARRGIECERHAPLPICGAEAKPLQVCMPRAVERVHTWPARLWSEVFQQAVNRVDLVLDLFVQVGKFRHELVMKVDRPAHRCSRSWSAYAVKNT